MISGAVTASLPDTPFLKQRDSNTDRTVNLGDLTDSLCLYLQNTAPDKKFFLTGISYITDHVQDDIDSLYSDETLSQLLVSYKRLTAALPLSFKKDPDINQGVTRLWLYTLAHYGSFDNSRLNKTIDGIKENILDSRKKETLKKCGRRELNHCLKTWKKGKTAAGDKQKAAQIILEVYDNGSSILDLSKMNLNQLPDELFRLLPHIQELCLSENQLTALPESLKYVMSLKKLDLSFNCLSQLPDWLEELYDLEELNLEFNRLKELPEIFDVLTNLKGLYLSNNILTKLPKDLETLGLTHLTFQNNPLKPVNRRQKSLPATSPIDSSKFGKYFTSSDEYTDRDSKDEVLNNFLPNS